MEAVRRHPLALLVVALILGLALVGGAVGVAQDATPGASPEACPDGSPVASPMASPIASPMASPEACPTGTPVVGGGQEVTVESVDIAFIPEALTIPANTDVTFLLPNSGAAQHNFSIDALSISVDQAPGQMDQKVVINAPAGTYEYYCNVPGHKQAGMVGTLTVQ